MLVSGWPVFAQNTVGVQLCRAVDSIGANLVEGDGRATDRDSKHFFVIARGSARETRHWIKRCVARKLIDAETAESWSNEIVQVLRMVHGLVRYREARTKSIAEDRASYGIRAEVNDPWSFGPSVPPPQEVR